MWAGVPRRPKNNTLEEMIYLLVKHRDDVTARFNQLVAVMREGGLTRHQHESDMRCTDAMCICRLAEFNDRLDAALAPLPKVGE